MLLSFPYSNDIHLSKDKFVTLDKKTKCISSILMSISDWSNDSPHPGCLGRTVVTMQLRRTTVGTSWRRDYVPFVTVAFCPSWSSRYRLSLLIDQPGVGCMPKAACLSIHPLGFVRFEIAWLIWLNQSAWLLNIQSSTKRFTFSDDKWDRPLTYHNVTPDQFPISFSKIPLIEVGQNENILSGGMFIA